MGGQVLMEQNTWFNQLHESIKQTALELARNGAEVILTSRSVTKGQAAMKNIEQDIKKTNKEDFDIKMTLLQLDLASLESVEQFALEFEKLNNGF